MIAPALFFFFEWEDVHSLAGSAVKHKAVVALFHVDIGALTRRLKAARQSRHGTQSNSTLLSVASGFSFGYGAQHDLRNSRQAGAVPNLHLQEGRERIES